MSAWSDLGRGMDEVGLALQGDMMRGHGFRRPPFVGTWPPFSNGAREQRIGARGFINK